MSANGISYRPDIDGLRAVAIVPVVLFHAGFSLFAGGFVGVDVFFVISGFLITSIIAREIEQGTFSFLHFYERRVRRLMPTLFTVLLTVLVAGFVLLSPFDFRKLANSLLFTLIFASNFHFADAGGYFDQPLGLAPLLHTWSLAVEEQFYIVWPPLLLLLMRYGRNALRVVVPALFFVSLGLAAYLTSDIWAAFYWPHTRAWELLVGCILALGLVPPPGHRRVADAASIAGLGLIAFAILTFDEGTPFPGLPALAPTLGAGLVIWAGSMGPSLGGRVLSWRPFVLIGLVSYAWYLWHWPLFAFFRLVEGREPAVGEAWALIGLSLALSFACWQFLEKPVRRRGVVSTRSVARIAVAGTAVLAASSAVVFVSHGFISRFPTEMAQYDRNAIRADKAVVCRHVELGGHRVPRVCQLHDGSDGGRSVLVWGDSHAGAYSPALAQMGQRHGARIYRATLAFCPPLIGIRSGVKRAERCVQHNERVIRVIKELGMTDVIMAMRWPVYVSDNDYARIPALVRSRQLMDAQSQAPSLDENRAVVERGLKRTLTALHELGVRVWITLPVPEPGFDVPAAMARSLMRGEDVRKFPPISLVRHRDYNRAIDAIVARLKAEGLVGVLDPADRLCDDTNCRLQIAGRPLYRDEDHVSAEGSTYLAPIFEPVFAAGLQPGRRQASAPGSVE